MLGYSSKQSAHELHRHHQKLKEISPSDTHSELDWAYGWIKDRNFMTAIDSSTTESWEWLRSAMRHAPGHIIDHYSAQSTPMPELRSNILPLRPVEKPTCRICHESIADNIVQVVKFTTLLCNCGSKMVHTHCVESYSKQCCLCKQYYIITELHSNVRSMIGARRGPLKVSPDNQSQTDSNGTERK